MVRNCRDTMTHFIHDNLPEYMPCHPVRRDPADRGADVLAINSVNLSFLNITTGNNTTLCTQQLVIDVVHEDENTAVDWVDVVLSLLRAAYFTPMLDYTVSTAPADTDTNIMWDKRRLTFKRITSRFYTHYSLLLSLRFSSQ